MTFIGIDPGSKGGIAIYYHIDDDLLTARPLIQLYPLSKMTEQDIARLLSHIPGDTIGGFFAVIEEVHSFPGQGVKSMFTFGKHYGFLRGCLSSSGIPFIEVRPQLWMSSYGIKKQKNEEKTVYKKRLFQKAQNLFPSVAHLNLETADSLLIVEYAKRIQTSEVINDKGKVSIPR